MEEYKNGKIERVLGIYTKLLNGYIVNKAAEANEYGVNERSIQRDVDDIRNYLELEAVNSGCLIRNTGCCRLTLQAHHLL